MTIRRDGSRRGGFRARWATAGDSVVLAGYVGPVRAIDAVLLGDSLYVALRPYDTGLTGALRPGSLVDARVARFLAGPWQFGDPWIREILDHASVEPGDTGYRLVGAYQGERALVRVELDLAPDGAPHMLRLGSGATGAALMVRYGPCRGYAVGRRPSWIEWSLGKALARLDVDELARVDRSRIRLPGPARPDWKMLALEDPRSEALFRRLLGGEVLER